MNITSQEKLDLKRLITDFQCDDNTENIRKLKHSSKINTDIQALLRFLVAPDAADISIESFEMKARETCPFLASTYPDIFMKILKKEIDLNILETFLNVLYRIEEGEIDQHEGSVYIGKLLKELYLDSAIRRGENLDKLYMDSTKPTAVQGKEISWSEYKKKTQQTLG